MGVIKQKPTGPEPVTTAEETYQSSCSLGVGKVSFRARKCMGPKTIGQMAATNGTRIILLGTLFEKFPIISPVVLKRSSSGGRCGVSSRRSAFAARTIFAGA